MKAWINEHYGSSDKLFITDIKMPCPSPTSVLVRIHAASINGSDREGLNGKPLYSRIGGLLKPRNSIRGSDIAGVVVAVGKLHKEFKVGDEVFGELPNYYGGFAEFVSTEGNTLAFKPDDLTYEQAAAIPQAGVIAYNGMRKQELVNPGESVLVNGAGGSGGSFAVQLASYYGAEVTGVDSQHKAPFIYSLGAKHFIDYEKEDFSNGATRYDYIFDLTASRSMQAYQSALHPNGRVALIGGSASTLLQALVLGRLIKLTTHKIIRVLAVPQSRTDLLSVTQLVTAGKIKPQIDKVYPFTNVPEAMRYIESGMSKGKVVISIY